jgi:hypothetical protein
MYSERDLVHFVGSVPLANAESVFTALASQLGRYLRRIPDGETGERTRWIVFQQRMLQQHPAMEVDPTQKPLPVRQSDGTVFREIQLLRLKADVDAERLTFDTGYDRAAIAAHQVYSGLRERRIIPPGVRFLFALPTPLATGFMYVSPAGRERYVRVYERSLMQALEKILASIPHTDLSIQFDVCQEVLMFESYFPVRAPDYKETIFRQFGRLAAAVPETVELGFHLCYGSPGDQPLLRLPDASVLAELMNGIADHVKRPVHYVHIPVPKSATQDFFEPLKGWRRPEGTRLYLGLLQHEDLAGDRRRIAAARSVLGEFGVAAECGFGRTDPARIPKMLESHRIAAETLAAFTAGRS